MENIPTFTHLDAFGVDFGVHGKRKFEPPVTINRYAIEFTTPLHTEEGAYFSVDVVAMAYGLKRVLRLWDGDTLLYETDGKFESRISLFVNDTGIDPGGDAPVTHVYLEQKAVDRIWLKPGREYHMEVEGLHPPGRNRVSLTASGLDVNEQPLAADVGDQITLPGASEGIPMKFGDLSGFFVQSD